MSQKTPDFEQLYYKAMRQIQLLTEKKIPIDLTIDQILFLKEVLFNELFEIKNMKTSIEDEADGDEKMKKDRFEDEILYEMFKNKKEVIESIIKKLNLE